MSQFGQKEGVNIFQKCPKGRKGGGVNPNWDIVPNFLNFLFWHLPLEYLIISFTTRVQTNFKNLAEIWYSAKFWTPFQPNRICFWTNWFTWTLGGFLMGGGGDIRQKLLVLVVYDHKTRVSRCYERGWWWATILGCVVSNIDNWTREYFCQTRFLLFEALQWYNTKLNIQ